MTLIEPSELRWREPPAVVSLGPCDSARVRSSIPKVNHVPSSCCWRQVAMEDLPELDAPFNTMSLAFTQPRIPVITYEERGECAHHPALGGSVCALAQVAYAEKSPLAWNTLQFAFATIIELDASAHHVATHCLADQQFARSS